MIRLARLLAGPRSTVMPAPSTSPPTRAGPLIITHSCTTTHLCSAINARAFTTLAVAASTLQAHGSWEGTRESRASFSDLSRTISTDI